MEIQESTEEKPLSGDRYPAALYVALHRGVAGDVDSYRALAAPGAHVLELGCGDGRLLEALSEQCTCCGIDLHSGMLDLAAERLKSRGQQVRVLRADMRSFTLPESFDLIIIPFNGLFCLAQNADVVACLERARLHLRPAGRIAFDVYDTGVLEADAAEVREEPDVDEEEELAQLCWNGTEYTVYESSRWWPSIGKLEACYRHESRAQPHPTQIFTSITHSYRSRKELVALCDQAGLDVSWSPLLAAGATPPNGPWLGLARPSEPPTP